MNKKGKNSYKGTLTGSILRWSLIACFCILPVTVQPRNAFACIQCKPLVKMVNPIFWDRSKKNFDNKLNREFFRLERFIIYEMWQDSILPILMLSAEQLTAVAMQQAMIIGTFIDAKQQLETQQLLQVLQARAHKDYHPSEGMCVYGSVMKALAGSERRAEFTSFVLSQRSQDRQLGNIQGSGMYGVDADKVYRINQFKAKYCQRADRDSALWDICNDIPWASMTQEQMVRLNKDIDYFETINSPWTVRVNFTNTKFEDSSATPPINNQDEEDVMALAGNLFAYEIFSRPPAVSLQNDQVAHSKLSQMQEAYMELRSIVAKRSVAENSYNAIAGEKAEGSRAVNASGDPVNDSSGQQLPMRSREFMEAVMKGLGVNSTDALKILGENPSYNAQMEILTKKIFQNPDFYTDLYDKPANVKRKEATLQAIRMMQKFDMLKSSLRSEASYSVLLELSVVELQREIEAQINTLDISETKRP